MTRSYASPVATSGIAVAVVLLYLLAYGPIYELVRHAPAARPAAQTLYFPLIHGPRLLQTATWYYADVWARDIDGYSWGTNGSAWRLNEEDVTNPATYEMGPPHDQHPRLRPGRL